MEERHEIVKPIRKGATADKTTVFRVPEIYSIGAELQIKETDTIYTYYASPTKLKGFAEKDWLVYIFMIFNFDGMCELIKADRDAFKKAYPFM